CAAQKIMSALPPKADMCGATRDVRFVPKADIRCGYSSMRLSARSKKSRLIGNPMLTTSLSLKSPRPRTPTLHLSAKCSVQLLFTRAKLCCANCFSVSVAGIQYVEHTDGDGGEMFKAVCKTWLKGTKSKSLSLQ
ncbi:MAG: hypothetical protein WCF76_12695, partial [Pseudolabrys sp.]